MGLGQNRKRWQAEGTVGEGEFAGKIMVEGMGTKSSPRWSPDWGATCWKPAITAGVLVQVRSDSNRGQGFVTGFDDGILII